MTAVRSLSSFPGTELSAFFSHHTAHGALRDTWGRTSSRLANPDPCTSTTVRCLEFQLSGSVYTSSSCSQAQHPSSVISPTTDIPCSFLKKFPLGPMIHSFSVPFCTWCKVRREIQFSIIQLFRAFVRTSPPVGLLGYLCGKLFSNLYGSVPDRVLCRLARSPFLC